MKETELNCWFIPRDASAEPGIAMASRPSVRNVDVL